MKITKEAKQTVGMSLVFSAVTLTAVFVSEVISTDISFKSKKRKLFAASLMTIAAIEAGCAVYLLSNAKKPTSPKGPRLFDKDNYEIFDDDNAVQSRKIIQAELHNKQDSDGSGSAAKPKYEIPLDDEATEADYAN